MRMMKRVVVLNFLLHRSLIHRHPLLKYQALMFQILNFQLHRSHTKAQGTPTTNFTFKSKYQPQ